MLLAAVSDHAVNTSFNAKYNSGPGYFSRARDAHGNAVALLLLLLLL